MAMQQMHSAPGRKRRGFSLIETTVAMFTLLVAALIFASAIPVANRSRGKAQYANIALSQAQKQLETIHQLGFANANAAQLRAAGLIDNTTPVNIHHAVLYGPPGTTALESSLSEAGLVDNTAALLPRGRSFVRIVDVSLDVKRVEVLVFWAERNNMRFVKLATLVANM